MDSPVLWFLVGFVLLLFLLLYLLVRRSRVESEVEGSLNDSESDEDYIPIVFISYRRSDSNDVSGRIYDRMIDVLPRDFVFKDVDSIPFGVDFRQYLAEMIVACDIVLAVIGSDWLSVRDEHGRRRLDDPGDFVRIEIEEALKRGIRVIPLLVRGASMPRDTDLPDGLKPLAFRNGIAIRPDPDFHNDMNRLLRDIGVLQ